MHFLACLPALLQHRFLVFVAFLFLFLFSFFVGGEGDILACLLACFVQQHRLDCCCNLVTGFVSWVRGSFDFFQKSFEVFVHLSVICVSFLGFRFWTLGRLRVEFVELVEMSGGGFLVGFCFFWRVFLFGFFADFILVMVCLDSCIPCISM